MIICATAAMKAAGGFDGAVGSFEKFLDYFAPLNNQLSVPIALIGLEAPYTFFVKHVKNTNSNKKIGQIVRLDISNT